MVAFPGTARPTLARFSLIVVSAIGYITAKGDQGLVNAPDRQGTLICRRLSAETSIISRKQLAPAVRMPFRAHMFRSAEL